MDTHDIQFMVRAHLEGQIINANIVKMMGREIDESLFTA